MGTQYEVARAVVRGDRPVDALADVGIGIENTAAGRRVTTPAGFLVQLPLADLAFGLLASWARSTELRDWASVIMMVSDIEFADIETDDGVTLLDALGAAAAEEEVPEQALDVARKLVG
jgi:hypothetical protein